MDFSLVFKNSGDELPFTAVNPELVEHYIESCNTLGINRFTNFGPQLGTIHSLLNNLRDTIETINEFIHLYLGKKLETHELIDYLDQAALNKYHADWANSHEIMFNIDEMRQHSDACIRAEFELIHDLYPDDLRDVTLIDMLNKRGRLEVYEKLNMNIHHLEASFRKVVLAAQTIDYRIIEYACPDSTITNDICNLKIYYNVKGRTLYDKFQFFDNKLEYDDENNHSTQSTKLELNLSQPQTIPLSTEYKAWCKGHNRPPTGDFLNLGNLKDIRTKITDYRQLLYRNLVCNDSCTLELKGE